MKPSFSSDNKFLTYELEEEDGFQSREDFMEECIDEFSNADAFQMVRSNSSNGSIIARTKAIVVATEIDQVLRKNGFGNV